MLLVHRTDEGNLPGEISRLILTTQKVGEEIEKWVNFSSPRSWTTILLKNSFGKEKEIIFAQFL